MTGTQPSGCVVVGGRRRLGRLIVPAFCPSTTTCVHPLTFDHHLLRSISAYISPRMACIHVPEDVQADIASHLPSSERQRLISTSHAFFRSALEDRYRTCGTEDQAQKILTAWHRWRGADPFLIIIPRLRRLRYADISDSLLQHNPHACFSDPYIAPLVREVMLVPSVTFFRSSPPRRYEWDDVAAGDEDSALR
jgi:hypothetical protein